MISIYPGAVFEQITPEVALLKRASDKVTSQFNTISETLVLMSEEEEVVVENFKAVSIFFFCVNLHDFQTKFLAWKSINVIGLLARVNRALNALLMSISFLVEESPVEVDIIHEGTHPMLVEIKAQIERLREKVVQIAGHEQIAEFDAKYAEEMRKYRMLRVMREEMLRNGGTGTFDFIEK
jgi:hypothetical protein